LLWKNSHYKKVTKVNSKNIIISHNKKVNILQAILQIIMSQKETDLSKSKAIILVVTIGAGKEQSRNGLFDSF